MAVSVRKKQRYAYWHKLSSSRAKRNRYKISFCVKILPENHKNGKKKQKNHTSAAKMHRVSIMTTVLLTFQQLEHKTSQKAGSDEEEKTVSGKGQSHL